MIRGIVVLRDEEAYYHLGCGGYRNITENKENNNKSWIHSFRGKEFFKGKMNEKKYWRPTTSAERFADLSIMSTENHITDTLEIKDLILEFCDG